MNARQISGLGTFLATFFSLLLVSNYQYTSEATSFLWWVFWFIMTRLLYYILIESKSLAKVGGEDV